MLADAQTLGKSGKKDEAPKAMTLGTPLTGPRYEVRNEREIASHPIRHELFPRLDKAQTIEEAEQVIHDAGLALAWLGTPLVADARNEQLVHDALARAVPQMLAIRGALERAAGTVTPRKFIVAHGTLKRSPSVRWRAFIIRAA